MDPCLTANLQAFIAHSGGTPRVTAREGSQRSSSVPPGASARQGFERRSLLEQRRKRGSVLFLDRMDADANSKAALKLVCAMRQDPDRRVALDRAVEKLRPAPEVKGPIVATYDHRSLWEGHNKKLNWAPLEYY
eukprot:CAMPEP_0177313178 /NCGR_PEP_ID=MMETSP0368-20130122/11271_1 /TAXON_ID=447022 ORGANISM="Scrippsiella hangoei-like, Strain SHHI-4" /NCGR_SAMPLE_ID=MMETSP0368 /ASSEMBLY_ACC=CAM_ASM_000363 /LENGTH=133 /DNA_ID=CAMNT_0018772261 /DNA_START=21 /DNA_END=422 /DNA_ORIENTATION=+